jgi:hypothetical protein
LAASYRQQIDGRFRNMDLQESRAMAEKRPEPVAEKPKPREASATDAPTRGPAAPRSAEPVPAVRTGPLGVFANALREGSAGTWAAAAAIINSHRGDSPLTRAADLFLSRGVSAWNLSDPERTTLIDAMSAHPDGPAEPTPVSCQASLDILAQGIAVPSGKSSPALTLFGCAELESLLAMERPVDAALLTRLGLRKSGVLGLWGPGARADRTDMARRLTLPDAGPVGRDPKRGPLPAEFADRYLSALLDLRQGVDVATVDVWRKLSGVAPDAAWAKMLGMAGERLHLALTCEICAGQGKSPCTACLGSGIASCTVCNGAGSTVDDCGGKVTCTACKGRGQALCTACQGGKTAVCPACNGKKTRAPASGALFRYLAELGLCEACKGDGSLFARVLYPCPKCDGLGRVMGEVPREMAKLPTWLKGASGATCWNALRWLAIHQNEDGSWASASWTARCTDPVCEAAPAGEYPVGVTSLALLAFLCAGVNPGTDFKWAGRIPAGQVVKKAVAWLVAHAGSGDIVQQDTDHSTLEHLLATLALALALSGSGSGEGTEADRAKHRETAVQAVKQTMALQGREGGWSARKGSPIDTWTTVWGAVALLAARDAGLDVPRGNLNRVLSWFTLVTDAGDLHLKLRPDQTDKLDYPGTEEFLDHPTLSASGAWLRIILEGKQTPSTQAAERLLLRDLPSDDPPARDFAWWFWGGEYLSQRATRGIPWTVWNGSLMKALLPLSETKWTCAFGSVAPSDRWGPIGGTVYSTAMGALALEAVLGQRPLVRIR